MVSFKKAAALAAGFGVACVSAAQAATAQNILSTDVVSVAPAVDFLSPFVNAVVAVAIPAAISWAAYELRKHRIVNFNDQQIAKLDAAAETEAGALLAASETNLAGMSFKVGSPEVAKLAANVEAAAPGVADMLGITPDGVAKIVAAKIGALQASATAPATAAPAK